MHLSPRRPRDMSAAGVASMASAAPSRQPRTLSNASCFLSCGQPAALELAPSQQGQTQGWVAQEDVSKQPDQ